MCKGSLSPLAKKRQSRVVGVHFYLNCLPAPDSARGTVGGRTAGEWGGPGCAPAAPLGPSGPRHASTTRGRCCCKPAGVPRPSAAGSRRRVGWGGGHVLPPNGTRGLAHRRRGPHNQSQQEALVRRSLGGLCPGYWKDLSFRPVPSLAPNPCQSSPSARSTAKGAQGSPGRRAQGSPGRRAQPARFYLWHTSTHSHRQGVDLCKLTARGFFDLHS